MGIYIDLNQTYQPHRSILGLKVFKKLMKVFHQFQIFEIETIRIWEGYPLESAGGRSNQVSSIEKIEHKHIYEVDWRDISVKGKTVRTIEVEGYFHFVYKGQNLRLLGQILLAGDEISKDYPDIYADIFGYNGLNFLDFLIGEKNENREKLLAALREIFRYKSKSVENIDVFIGESPESVVLLHECRYIQTRSMNWLLSKFVKYIYALRNINMKQISWITLRKADINNMYNRLNYLRKDFIPKAARLMVIEDDKEGHIEDFLHMRTKQFVEVATGSLIISDRDFSGKDMRRLLNELLYVFSQVMQDVFKPRKDIEEEFASSFEKIIKEWG